jgi:hypothetical protein
MKLPCGISKAAKMLIALSVPWVLACAGTPNVLPVYLPGDPVDCLFEVIGDVTVSGPFRAVDDVPGGAREAMLQGVRLEVGRRVAESGADAAMVREFIYDVDTAGAEASTPEIIAVEGMLVSFVDPTCVAGA